MVKCSIGHIVCNTCVCTKCANQIYFASHAIAVFPFLVYGYTFGSEPDFLPCCHSVYYH